MEIETLLDYVLDSEEIIDGLPYYEDLWVRNQIEKLQWNMNELKKEMRSQMKHYSEIPKFDIKRIESSNELAVVDRATGKLIGIGKMVFSDKEPNEFYCNFEILGVKKTKEDDLNCAVVELLITNFKDHEKFIMEDKLILTNKNMAKLASFFRSIGLKKYGVPMKMQWDGLEELTGKCILQEDSNGNYNIKQYLDKTDGENDV